MAHLAGMAIFFLACLPSIKGAMLIQCPEHFDKICFKVHPSLVCKTQSDCKDDKICCQTGCLSKICTTPVIKKSPVAAPQVSSNNTNTNNATIPKPVHKKKEEEAKKGKPYSLHCVVAPRTGNPVIEWSAEKTKIDMSSEKYEYHKGDSRVLTITDVTFADRDVFTCKSTHENVTSTLAIRLRVRDPMGAIWPTIGILVESVLLFLVIFVYEYRRTKTEGDDSTKIKARKDSDGQMRLVK